MINKLQFRFIKTKQDLYKIQHDGAGVIFNNMLFYSKAIEGLLAEGAVSSELMNRCAALLADANNRLGEDVRKRHFTRACRDNVRNKYQKVGVLVAEELIQDVKTCNGFSIVILIETTINTMRGILSREFELNNRFYGEIRETFKQKERPHIVSIFGGINFSQKILDDEIILQGDICKSELPFRFRFCYIYLAGLRYLTGKLYERLQLINPHIMDDSFLGDAEIRIKDFQQTIKKLGNLTVVTGKYGRTSYEEINILIKDLCIKYDALYGTLSILDEFIASIFEATDFKSCKSRNKKQHKQAIKDLLNQHMSYCHYLMEISKAGIELCIFRFCGGEIRKYGELIFIPGQGINLLNDRDLLDSLF